MCTPLVDEQRGRLRVSRLDPGGEEALLVSLVPQVLVQVRVCDLLQRLNLIHRDQVTAQHHSFSQTRKGSSSHTRIQGLLTALLLARAGLCTLPWEPELIFLSRGMCAMDVRGHGVITCIGP